MDENHSYQAFNIKIMLITLLHVGSHITVCKCKHLYILYIHILHMFHFLMRPSNRNECFQPPYWRDFFFGKSNPIMIY